MELRELTCKNCGAPIHNDDLHWDLSLARCSHCGTIFSLRGVVQDVNVTSNVATAPPERRQPVGLPKGIEMFESGGGLHIVYRWLSLKYIFMLVFAVFWNGFMLVWHGISLSTGTWFMSVFGLLHTAVGLGLAYGALAGLLNKTTIWVEQGLLAIRHHPMPWPGNKQLMADQIEQLYSKEKVSHSRNGGTSYSYQVYAVQRDSTTEKLLSNLATPEQALYVEQEIERYLGIYDQPVRGELPR